MDNLSGKETVIIALRRSTRLKWPVSSWDWGSDEGENISLRKQILCYLSKYLVGENSNGDI